MNQERPNEAAAKDIVERTTGVDLEHADTNGGVDYLSPDGTVALEVTAVTNGEKKGARDALRKSVAKDDPTTELQGCWIVFAPDNQSKMKTFVQRVKPALAELELAGISRFDQQSAAIHVLQGGAHASLYKPLLEAGVEQAAYEPHPQSQDDPAHSHQMLVSTGSGGSASGSDEAVDRLMSELNTRTDDPKKLLESGAEQRHLFVWLNDDSPHKIARPLSHTAPSSIGWGLPTVTPKLDPAITHLWVMHERSGKGWRWDGNVWAELQDPR